MRHARGGPRHDAFRLQRRALLLPQKNPATVPCNVGQRCLVKKAATGGLSLPSPLRGGVGGGGAAGTSLEFDRNRQRHIFARGCAQPPGRRSRLVRCCSVLEARTECPLTPTPDPSPQGGGEKQRRSKNAGIVSCNVSQRCFVKIGCDTRAFLSPPPCGEGSGVGVPRAPRSSLIATANDIFLRADARNQQVEDRDWCDGGGNENSVPVDPHPRPLPARGRGEAAPQQKRRDRFLQCQPTLFRQNRLRHATLPSPLRGGEKQRGSKNAMTVPCNVSHVVSSKQAATRGLSSPLPPAGRGRGWGCRGHRARV